MDIVGKKKRFFAGILTLVISVSVPMKVSAAESVVLPTYVLEQDIIAVDLPALQEEEGSPFDFIIDPQHLIFETGAEAYGGGVVEEEANLLFHNQTEGAFDFSRYSDKLTVVNRSTIPVMVTISADIADVGDIEIVQDKDFPEDGSPYMYLAIVDDEGNEQPVAEDGTVSMSVEMQRAPESVYAYTLNPETGDYEYKLSGASEDADFDTYSFGLTGECSSDADWGKFFVLPKITVTWRVEPILTEEADEEKTEEENEEENIDKGNINKENINKENINKEKIEKETQQEKQMGQKNEQPENRLQQDTADETENDKNIEDEDILDDATEDEDDVNKEAADKDILKRSQRAS